MIEYSRSQILRADSDQEHALYDGTLTPEEARDMAFGLLKAAISGHKLRNLRSQVNREQPDEHAVAHIRALEESREELNSILSQAAEAGQRVRLRSVLQIELESDPTSRIR